MLLAILFGCLGSIRAAKPPIIDWEEPLPDKERREIREAIWMLAQQRLAAEVTEFRYECVRTAALLQAMPELAAYAAAKATAEGKPKKPLSAEEFGKQVTSHVRNHIKKVLERVLPEYWQCYLAPKEKRKELWLINPKAKEIRTVRTVREIIDGDGERFKGLEHLEPRGSVLMYEVPFALMCIEYYFAGMTELEPGLEPRLDRDRRAQPIIRLPELAQLGVARLVDILLSADPTAAGKEEEGQRTAPQTGYLWEYRSFANSESCMSKSGAVVMGLRAAVNMGLLDFGPSAFAYRYRKEDPSLYVENDTPQKFRDRLADRKARFRYRLWDVLFHATVTLADSSQWIVFKSGRPAAVKGAEEIVKRLPKGSTSPTTFPPKSEILDVLEYRTLTGTDKEGKRICRVEKVPANGLKSRGVTKLVVAYPYHGGAYYRAYHTASGAYIMCVCSNILDQLLQSSAGKGLGVTYQASVDQSRAKHWRVTLKDAKGNPKALFDISRDSKGPFTRLRIVRNPDASPDKRAEIPISDRIAQAINLSVVLLAKPAKKGRSNLRGGDGVPQWLLSLPFGDESSVSRYSGLALYGVMKAYLACGYTDYVGPFPWYRQVAAVLRTKEFNNIQGIDSYAGQDFRLMVLSRGYRPLFLP
jgi:hypothetical protein